MLFMLDSLVFGFEEIFSFLFLEDFIHLENKNKVKMWEKKHHINEKEIKLLKKEENDFSPVKIKPFTNDLHEGHEEVRTKNKPNEK